MTTPTGPAADGAALLAQLHTALTRYVILPSAEAAVAVALWIAATHAQASWAHAPRLVIRAPEKRCGKSRLLDIVEGTCHAPLITVNASPAAVYRAIGSDVPPTLLVDEADTIFGGKNAEANEDLRGLLNAGHQRNRPAIRWDNATRSLETIPTFAMAALAGIGAMPDTIEDRAVVIRMRRRAPGEKRGPVPAPPGPARPHRPGRRARPLARRAPARAGKGRAGDAAGGPGRRHLGTADRRGRPGGGGVARTGPARRRGADRRPGPGRRPLRPHPAAGRLPDRLRGRRRPAQHHPGDPAPFRPRSALVRPAARHHPQAAGRACWPTTTSGPPTIRFPEPIGQVKGYYRADFTDAWARYCPPPAGERVPAVPSRPRPAQARDGSKPGTASIRPTKTPVPG